MEKVTVGNKEYSIPQVLTVELYETILPILSKLPEHKLLEKDIKLSEITMLLAQANELTNFLGLILNEDAKVFKNIDINEAINVVSIFFSSYGLIFMTTGLFYFPQELQEKINANIP